MYVTKSDYKGRIQVELFDLLLTEDEEGILSDASKTAEDTISSQVNTIYNVTPELAKAGTDRNFYILSMAVNIALYYIYQRADDNEVPDKVIKNYDDTMDDLAAISKGKQTLNLPPREDTDPVDTTTTSGNPSIFNNGLNPGETITIQGKGLRRWGSNPKRSHMP